MALVTVLKIDINCQKCKTNVLKAVTIEGVDKVDTNEEKGTVAVTGTADPYEIIIRARKAISCARKYAEVVSIGPPKKAEPEKKPPEKKSPEKKPPPCTCPPAHCLCPPYYPPSCEAVVVMPYETTYPPCSIL